MSGITKILTRTPSELGSIKTNKSPIVEENKQLPAEQWNTAADAIIEIQTVIGEAANPAAGTITEVLSDHEERIDELEQSGGGGGPTDRIESESGAAFAEATDDFLGMGTSAVLSRTNHSSGSAIAYTAILPGEGGPSHPVLMANIAATNADETQSAGIGAQYDPTTEEFRLRATGAPLQVEEPIESNHAATKGYVDSQAGGGGTPGHVICNVTEDDPPLEPVPQRANLVFFSDAGKVEVQDFEELDATVVLIPEGGGGGGGNPSQIIYDLETPNGQAHAYAYVSGFYDENTDEEQVSFQVDLRDSDNHMTEIYMTRGTEGQLLVLNLDQADPSAPSFSMVNHSAFGDPEFRLTKAPTLIETPTKPMHAATKGYVDARPGADAWSEHAATEDVGLDGHKITGLGEPTDAADAATKGYVDARMPTLEWWDPVWTPVSNVDSVANVECSYTRTYRAAGGSLVTLEGTIKVTPDAAGQCAVTVDLPIARVGTDAIVGVASFIDGNDSGIATVSIQDLGAGQRLAVLCTPDTVAVHHVSFRVSYRAA